MALHTKAKFATLCNIPNNRLTIYINRVKGKTRVVVRKDGLIDDEDPVNVYFLNKRTVHSEKKGIVLPGVSETKPISAPHVPVKMVTQAKKPDLMDEKRTLLYEGDRLAMQLKNEKLEAEIIKIRLANQKSMGEFARVDQVKSLFVVYSESLNSAVETIFDDLIRRVSLKYQLTREEITELKAEKNNSINKAKERAIKIAKDSLRKAQQALSEKKGVGDHQ